MNQSFYTGATGAHQQMRRMNVLGNNIANINTYGYKAQRGRFAALMYENPPRSIDREPVYFGVGTALWQIDTDFNSGILADTGRKQDYAIAGEGFFAVVDLTTDEVTLTRNGAFCISELMRPTNEVGEDGQLVLDEFGQPLTERIYYLSDNEGRFVLSENGGMIEVDPEERNEAQPVGVFDYLNYNGMERLYDTRFRAVAKNGGMRRASGVAMQGMLETSNADLAEEYTKIIETQRAYGMALKMVQASDEIETTINGLR